MTLYTPILILQAFLPESFLHEFGKGSFDSLKILEIIFSWILDGIFDKDFCAFLFILIE